MPFILVKKTKLEKALEESEFVQIGLIIPGLVFIELKVRKKQNTFINPF